MRNRRRAASSVPSWRSRRAWSVGSRTRVQSHTFICELVSIGEDCFIGHGVMFINDLFSEGGPAQGRMDLWKSTRIGNHVSIGSNATILPVRICDRVVDRRRLRRDKGHQPGRASMPATRQGGSERFDPASSDFPVI